MNLKTQVAGGIKWLVIDIVGRKLLSLVVFAILARILEPADFGLVGLVGVYLAFVGLFADQGIGLALVQRKNLETPHLNAAFWFNVFCGLVLCISTIAFAGRVAEMFHEPRLMPLLRFGSLALVINATTAVHLALFTREMDFRRPAIRALITNAFGGFIGVSMALTGFGVWALIGQQLAGALAGSGFIWAASDWRPSGWGSKKHLRQLMTVSTSVLATNLLWCLSSQIDQVAIGRYIGAAMLGQYVVGKKLSDMAYACIHLPIATVAMPILSKLQCDHAQLCRAIYKGMELNTVISFAVYGGIAAVAPSLIPVFFGNQWGSAALLLQLTSCYGLAAVFFVYCYPALLATGGPGRCVIVNATCAAGAVTVCIIAIRFSVLLLVTGLIANLVMVGFIQLLFLQKQIGLSPRRYCRPAVVPALAATIMFLLILIIRSSIEARMPALLSLLIQMIAGVCSYIGVVSLMASASLIRLWDMVNSAIRQKALAN